MADQSNSTIITASSSPTGQMTDNSNIITASSRHGFTPTAQPQKETTVTPTTPSPSTVSSMVKDTFMEAMQEKVTPQAEREAAKLMKTLMQSALLNFRVGDFQTGNMLFYRYDAKDKDKTYDKTPLIMVLRKSKSYVLGINFHWTPIPLRITLIKLILKFNRNNIIRGNPIVVSYEMLKPFIMKMGLGPVIRLYIFNRISRRGLVVPPTHWLIAAKLRAESFNNGKSAEQAYQEAVKKYKATKINRGRRESTYK